MCVSWWGLACLDELLLFLLGEICVWDLKIFKVCIYIWNVWVWHMKGPTKGHTRRTQGWSRNCLGSVNRWDQYMIHWLTWAPSIGRRRWSLILRKSFPFDRHWPNRCRAQNGPSLDKWPVNSVHRYGSATLPAHYFIKRVNGNFNHFINLL